jgi:tetratricopeptide (TPR) repeat protein
VVTVQQLNRKIPTLVAVACFALAAGCATHSPSPSAKDPPAKDSPAKADPAALTVVAEVALEGGDCKKASETYAQAAAIGTAPMLASRATKVALACEHLPAAWQSATRWRSLAPTDREANALYAAVALKLYKISDARSAISEYWRETQAQAKAQGASAGAGTGNGTASKPGPTRAPDEAAEEGLAELTQLLLDQSGDTPAVLTAMSGALEPGASSSATTLALLGGLALDAFDAQRAEHYAQESLKVNPHDLSAERVLSRAYVMRGDSAKAIATARDAMQQSGAGAFELVDVLEALDRFEEAHQELERLRSSGVAQPEIDRRLALLAYQAGDMKEAQQRFAELVSSGEGNDQAMLFLADIAARDGDTEAAIAGYRRLYDSTTVAVSARSRAASLLLDKKNRTEALTLLDDYVADHPDNEYELTLAKARLLADHGEPEAGLALLATALERHPKHPSIEYERAVMLEQAGHVHESVEAMEKLLAERPDDPTLLNSLGYTMADHGLELGRAEGLIKRALGTTPDNPAALDSLGWVRFRQGDAKAAAVVLGHAYSLGHDAEIAAHWGEALWVSGDHQQARKVWAQALAREPDSQPLKATLARFVPDASPH